MSLLPTRDVQYRESRERQVIVVEELDDVMLAALETAEVPPEHAHLDELVKDWEPDASKAARSVERSF